MKRSYWRKIIMIGIVSITIYGLSSIVFSNSILVAEPGAKTAKSIYDITLQTVDGNKISLGEYRGKKLLIVNVASHCGYTSQYSRLEELYRNNKDKVVIIAVPCNDFGRQEPGSEKEIKEFCDLNFGITFPIISKSNIKTNPKSELYSWLSNPNLNGWNEELPSWNFCKYLINEKGELTHFFRSNISPTSKQIKSLL
tara:strand:+ start:865 stop:1455 length:591 start_codon:yes stop_codon:yes gene_type:complete